MIAVRLSEFRSELRVKEEKLILRLWGREYRKKEEEQNEAGRVEVRVEREMKTE